MAKKPGPFYLGSEIETIREIMAMEHVWGRKVPRTKEEGEVYRTAWEDNVEACKNKPCERLMDYWMMASLSIFYDGESEIAGQVPFMIELFKKEGWSLDNLLEIQKNRINTALNSIIYRTKLHNYSDWKYGINDIINNISILQELVRETYKK